MNDDHKMAGIISMAVCALALIIGTQIRGCSRESNAHIAELAKHGIRAEIDVNGKLKILDTRDFRSLPKEKE